VEQEILTYILCSVGRMWLSLEDAGESERLDRYLLMIWEIGVVINGRIRKCYLCFTYTLVSVMSFFLF